MSRILIFFLFFVAGPAGAQESTKVKVNAGVSYCKFGNHKDLKMDIACPEGKGPHPAVICIHGGAWRLGNRRELNGLIKYLAEQGYVAAAVSYRLLPDAKFPDPLVDCKTAVRFLRANAEHYHINKDKIGALGYSAGGHLACMMGTTDKNADFEGKEYANESSKVQAVVSYFGPTDLTYYRDDESAQNSVFLPMLGSRYKDNPTAYEKASPISYVSKGGPPFLFLHGTKDWLVPVEQSRSMQKKLKEVGVQAELVEIEGGSHGFRGADKTKATRATIKFLDENLKK